MTNHPWFLPFRMLSTARASRRLACRLYVTMFCLLFLGFTHAGEPEVKAAKAAASEEAVKAVPPQPAAAQPDAKQVEDAMTMQFVQQYRPILNSELAFIRQICEIEKEKRPKIKAMGEASLKEAAKGTVDLQQGRIRVQNAADQRKVPNPPKIIQVGLAKALEENLPPEQFVRYREESDKRKEAKKRAAIYCIVSRLDDGLRLSKEQREKISKAIADKWEDHWEQWLMIENYEQQYVPSIPDPIITPALDAQQKAIWTGWQKIDFGYWYQQRGIPLANDEWWDNEVRKPDEPGEPAKPAISLPAIFRLFTQ